MNKLKKIGISALAGTLASLSAQAGEMSVSGTAELTYTQRDNDETTGNPLGQKKNISFSGSGELDNGWTVSIFHSLNDTFTGQSSSSMSIGMGALGSLHYDSGTGGYGLNAIDNVVPIAFEEADYGMATGMIDVGTVVGNQGSFHWKAPEMFPGLAIQLGYTARGGSGSVADGGTGGEVGAAAFKNGYSGTIQFSPEMLPGLTVGAGMGENEDGGTAVNQDREEETYFATYAFGPLSVGYQTSTDDDNGTTEYNTDVYGASFNINDVFSVSYQYGETEYNHATATDVTAEFEGISAAYNIGPMAIKFTTNDGKNVGGTASNGDENRELNLSMAF
jgi:outer membrane protein OmpU